MKDTRIRYRPAERAALVRHAVKAFCLVSGNLRAAQMAEQFLVVRDQILDACTRAGPMLYAVTRSGLREVDLSD